MWNNESELNFLEIYQSEPVLWDPTHPYHKDKKKLHDAWTRISEKTEFPVEDLKKKKASLMATYRHNVRGVNTSSKSGAGTEELHKPIWFAFELMHSFLGNVYKCKQTINTANENNQPSTWQDEFESEANVHANDTENQQLSDATFVSQDSSRGDVSPSFVSPTVQRRRKNPIELQQAGQQMKDAMSSLNNVLKKQEVPEDDCERYGKILANKLRKLPELERMQLMWEIDGLYISTVQKKPLHAQSQLFTPSPSPSPTPHSSYSAYLERNVSQNIIPSHDFSACSTPSPILNNIGDIPAIQTLESSQLMPSKAVTVLSNEVVAPAQFVTYSEDSNIVNKAFYHATH